MHILAGRLRHGLPFLRIDKERPRKIAYRVGRDGNLSMGIGRVSFSEADLLDNLTAVVDQIAKSRPSTVKGTFIEKSVLASTMGPGVPFTFNGRN